MNPALARTVAGLSDGAGAIAADRRATLDALGDFVAAREAAGRDAHLVFVCTHNSRRSLLAEAWALAGARAFGLRRVVPHSAGTEATAAHPGALAALARAGFLVEIPAGANPRVGLRTAPDDAPHALFSKALGDPALPARDFLAVMTCAEADAACPAAPGAAARLALPFEDPKAADGTPREAAVYDARCAQIGREILHALSRAATR